jgi:hypothetical protein
MARVHLRIPVAALALLVAGACRLDLTRTVPLQGPAPTAVVVAPFRDHTGGPGLVPVLPAGLDAALRARGYRVLPLEVGHDLLRERALLQRGEPRPEELLAAGRDLDVDAVLVVDVHRFLVEGEGELDAAEWELDYRLLATDGGGLLWQRRLVGRYRRPAGERFDPTVDPMAERPPRPFGVSGPAAFRDLRELSAALHRAAFDHLPRR